jgi:RNA polymerase sigma-70 factor (ECF subfamily)
MRNASMTLTSVGPLTHVDEGEITMQMDEETFRAFYDSTARSAWLYLLRVTHDTHLADDLLQETYYRFLRTERSYDSEAHRRNYLFRIATNLARDRHRRRSVPLVDMPGDSHPDAPRRRADEGELAARRTDLSRAMARLKPRDRALLWLAYANGSSHVEIAESLGVKSGSVKALLLRARRRLAGLLTGEARA